MRKRPGSLTMAKHAENQYMRIERLVSDKVNRVVWT